MRTEYCSVTVITMPANTCRSSRPNTFDLVRSPLEGFNLIDASAGTGKTYTICGLVLRLILEKELTIEQILVVTYTEAATEDLRDRVRQKLRQALDGVGGNPGNDPFLQEYLAGIKDEKKAASLLSEALRAFDEAAIYTIHGFCQRMLLEHSFESNTLFDTELIADDSYLFKEIIEDFWRRNFFQNSSLFSRYAIDRLSPDGLHDFLRPLIPHPFLQFIPDIDFKTGCSHLSDTEAEFTAAYLDVCREWPAARDAVSRDLLYSPAFNRNIYRKAFMPVLISRMDDMAARCIPEPHLFDRFHLITGSRISSGTKTKETANVLPFHELCDNLVRIRDTLQVQYDRCLLALKKRLLDSFRHELSRRKARDNVFSFDDLLQKLHGALSGPGGSSLARAIAKKYPAALIDEFQDTDPLQFEIFKAIYHERSLLFLIGDPKQAIYSFRGADIFTYMDAAAASPFAHHTLGVNHRSTPELVKAINTVFCRAEKSFIFDAISFHPVAAAQKREREYLTIDDRREEPFILWYLNRTMAASDDASSSRSADPKITKSAARSRIISMVTAEICRLLRLAAENRVRINGRKLLPGDMAILVRTNDEAGKMQQALTAMHVTSVLHSGDDLFAAGEAEEMSLLLGAIAMPNRLPAVKTGLTTRFIGLPAADINLLQANSPENETIIEYWLTKFRTYHALWKRYGFIRMFWTVMRENLVRQRLLAAENGERSLTNILHLAEILHQEAENRGLNMTALLEYLQDRRAADRDKNIEHQLRLESDEGRVKIVTIHKAKGLEYPVVFCPFAWNGLRTDAVNGCLFHRQQAGQKTELLFDAGSPRLETHLQEALQEEMAENLRILYVALTRAVHRCYLAWGPINGAETSAPAYLLHQGSGGQAGSTPATESILSLMQRTAARFSGLSDQEILVDLQELSAAAQGSVRISATPETPPPCLPESKEKSIALRPLKFNGDIARDWKISSFSSLITGSSTLTDASQVLRKLLPDRDEFPAEPAVSVTPAEQKNVIRDIFSFPHGSGPGTFLHELLEQADFSRQAPVAPELIDEKLQHFGFETEWNIVVAEMLANLGCVRLHNHIPELKFSNISRTNCLHELEFYFPLSRVTPDVVKLLFNPISLPGSADATAPMLEQQLDSLTFAPSRGFMRGFIDLVFEFDGRYYLVDWKSNYLGSDIENYRRDKLIDSILSGFYFLQYHIYCLALHLYLERRLPGYQYENHFGGAFYVFLRGVRENLGPGYGIYHDLPDLPTIERLRTLLPAGPIA